MSIISRLKRRAKGPPSDSLAGGSVVDAVMRFGPGRRPPAESDSAVRQALLLQLALKALDRIIADYSGAIQRQPSYAALAQYLDGLERGRRQPAPARATDAPSRKSTSETPALLQPQPRATAA